MELEGTSNCNQIGSLTDVGNEIGENRYVGLYQTKKHLKQRK